MSSTDLLGPLPPPHDSAGQELYLVRAINLFLQGKRATGYPQLINVYSSVFNLIQRKRSRSNDRRAPIYKILRDTVSEHVREKYQAAKDLRDDELLSFYHTEWSMFATAVAGFLIAFKHLDSDIGPIGDSHGAPMIVGYLRIYIKQMLHILWRDELVRKLVDSNGTSTLSTAIVNYVASGPIDEEMLKSVALSFVSIGIDDTFPYGKNMDEFNKYYWAPLRENFGEDVEGKKGVFVYQSTPK